MVSGWSFHFHERNLNGDAEAKETLTCAVYDCESWQSPPAFHETILRKQVLQKVFRPTIPILLRLVLVELIGK